VGTYSISKKESPGRGGKRDVLSDLLTECSSICLCIPAVLDSFTTNIGQSSSPALSSPTAQDDESTKFEITHLGGFLASFISSLPSFCCCCRCWSWCAERTNHPRSSLLLSSSYSLANHRPLFVQSHNQQGSRDESIAIVDADPSS
jgi:hypothetical protein